MIKLYHSRLYCKLGMSLKKGKEISLTLAILNYISRITFSNYIGSYEIRPTAILLTLGFTSTTQKFDIFTKPLFEIESFTTPSSVPLTRFSTPHLFQSLTRVGRVMVLTKDSKSLCTAAAKSLVTTLWVVGL